MKKVRVLTEGEREVTRRGQRVVTTTRDSLALMFGEPTTTNPDHRGNDQSIWEVGFTGKSGEEEFFSVYNFWKNDNVLGRNDKNNYVWNVGAEESSNVSEFVLFLNKNLKRY